MTLEKISYNIGVDKHVLEDERSVKRFIDNVKTKCSNISENRGCVFEHIEINTDIDDRKEICLFEELDGLGIKYDKSAETDECIEKNIQNRISIDVHGTRHNCDDDGKCKSFKKTDAATIAPDILDPYGEISFKYLQLKDPDGFPGRNNDGTYHLDNPIGIHGIPDVPFKESRSGIITFDGTMTSNPLTMMDFETCDSVCNSILSGKKMASSVHSIGNEDMFNSS